MKCKFSLTTVLVFVLMFVLRDAMAQAPGKISYQAVVRDSAHQLIVDQQVGIRISLIQNVPEGVIVYQETHLATTNVNGLLSIEIGSGNTSDELGEVDWSEGSYYLKTEVDPEGQDNYTIVATNELLSVPYALHAKSAEQLSVPIEESDPVFVNWNRSDGIHIAENQIVDLQAYLLEESDPLFAGSVAASISQEDIDTWNSANSEVWVTNGNNISYASGNVGIGEGSPLEKLHVKDGAILVTGSNEQGGTLSVTGAGSRMFFNPWNASFRAGIVSGNQWDASNVGFYSVAMGENATASGLNAIAFGRDVNANGGFSIAIGKNAKSTSDFSIAIGSDAESSGYESIALGSQTKAIGDRSTTMGFKSQASGISSVAMGFDSRADGYGSVAGGGETKASGKYSFSIGNSTHAKAYASFVLGQFNDTTVMANSLSWEPTDAVLVVGNGTGAFQRSNAFVLFKNGSARFLGVQQDGPDLFPTKVLWDAPKGVFRAGRVDGVQWDDNNCGVNSFAVGHNTIASGTNTVAMGNNSIASVTFATAIGYYSKASSYGAVAMGLFAEASGWGSFSAGFNTQASSHNSFVIGRFNQMPSNANSSSWVSTDPLFVVGNGSSNSSRSNAMLLLKNGSVSFYGTQLVAGNPFPTRMFWVADKAAFRSGRVDGTQWDDSNIGIMSFSSGLNNIASGPYSFAAGYLATASNAYSIAMGNNVTASAAYSVSIGNLANATAISAVALGSYAKAYGEGSYALGYSAEASGMYSIAMGNMAKAIGSRAFAIHLGSNVAPSVGNSEFLISGASLIGGNLPWTNNSDRRLKKDIVYIENENNLGKIMKLKGVRYHWIENDSLPYLGFIAQDVINILPESVRYSEQNDLYSMEYTAIIPILVEGIKEQQQIIEHQQQQIDELKKAVEQLLNGKQ